MSTTTDTAENHPVAVTLGSRDARLVSEMLYDHARQYENEADELEPSDENLPAHAWAMNMAESCKRVAHQLHGVGWEHLNR